MTLCSFIDDSTGARGRSTLAHLGLPDGVMNIGRLDRDSEGLLLLTDDGELCHTILQGGGVSKRYFALVRGQPSDTAIESMADGGMQIRGRMTRACSVRRLPWDETHAAMQPQPVQIQRAQHSAENTAWLEVILHEGCNRQVRKTTAHAGHATLRLVRVGIGDLRVDDLDLSPGEWRPVERGSVFADGAETAETDGPER
jgi:23S rRNA pseudouridine2457 synthase